MAWYRRHAEWKYLLKILPSAVVGLGWASPWAEGCPTMGSAICRRHHPGTAGAHGLARRAQKEPQYPQALWFAIVAGLAAGFTTMIGNAAGAITSIYLLAMRLPKNSFIGTVAWFFLIINLLKVPLQIFFWKNISAETLTFNVLMIPPAIAAGAAIASWRPARYRKKAYRVFVNGHDRRGGAVAVRPVTCGLTALRLSDTIGDGHGSISPCVRKGDSCTCCSRRVAQVWLQRSNTRSTITRSPMPSTTRIMRLAHDDEVIDLHEQALLRELNAMIGDGTVKRVP